MQNSHPPYIPMSTPDPSSKTEGDDAGVVIGCESSSSVGGAINDTSRDSLLVGTLSNAYQSTGGRLMPVPEQVMENRELSCETIDDVAKSYQHHHAVVHAFRR